MLLPSDLLLLLGLGWHLKPALKTDNGLLIGVADTLQLDCGDGFTDTRMQRYGVIHCGRTRPGEDRGKPSRYTCGGWITRLRVSHLVHFWFSSYLL